MAAPGDERWMRLALDQAREASRHGDVPVGCVVVREDRVVGAGHNEREARPDPTAHAEILALRAAALTLGGWRLMGTTLYVTLEPCPMCAGAIRQARVGRVVYGAADHKLGAAGTVVDVLGDPRLIGRVPARGGCLGTEAGALLADFFAERR
ncbi:MAG: tRNA adenosine(34) deaminase TadA [Miltoncostaeaceae bacterium]